MGTIPLSTWEQAGIVVLFAVLMLGFLGLGYKYVQTVIKEFRSFIDNQNKEWQAYLNQVRDDDRKEIEAREIAFGERNAGVVKAMEELTKTIQDMRIFDASHHASMTDAISDMRSTVRAMLARGPKDRE